jgi:tetratricopeptide (TPR) repeat protein
MNQTTLSLFFRNKFSWFFAFLLFLTIPTGAVAQSLGANRGDAAGSGGSRSIQGRIFSPTGKMPESGIRITLETPRSGTLTTFADADGAFIFNNLSGGSYQVTIDAGKQYETVRESINLESTPVYQLPVYLRLKPENNPAFTGVPKSAIDLYNKGAEAGRNGDSKKAIEQLQAALALHPQFAAALNELGVQYIKLGQMDKAAETYEAVLKLNPRDASAHLNLGIALYNLSVNLLAEKKIDESRAKLTQTEQHLREAIKINSNGPTAHYYLGLTLIKFKKYDEAQKEIELAIANGGDNLALAHKYLGGLYMNAKRNKDAADQLENYLQLDPKARDAEQIRTTIKDLRSKQ